MPRKKYGKDKKNPVILRILREKKDYCEVGEMLHAHGYSSASIEKYLANKRKNGLLGICHEVPVAGNAKPDYHTTVDKLDVWLDSPEAKQF